MGLMKRETRSLDYESFVLKKLEMRGPKSLYIIGSSLDPL